MTELSENSSQKQDFSAELENDPILESIGNQSKTCQNQPK